MGHPAGPRRVSVMIPTLNAGKALAALLGALQSQTIPCETVVVDSGSTDDTAAIAGRCGVGVHSLAGASFDHGGTRTLAAKISAGEILVFMTQDALPADKRSLENLLRPFEDNSVAAVYGRQLPHPGASLFGTHLRLFNYPETSMIKRLKDKDVLGIKTPFLSNSFAAYRRTDLEKTGWFRDHLIMGEDTCAGARLLMAGHAIAYASDAAVYHSHDYTLFGEFRRYFDIGVFHTSEDWILSEFGGAGGEGMVYLKSAIKYITKNGKYLLLPELLVRTGLKLIGYSLGRRFRYIPAPLRKKLSMHPDWWNKG